ncbi:MAG: hypothetical protein ACO1NQ_04610 [Flavobacteriales bacterium]
MQRALTNPIQSTNGTMAIGHTRSAIHAWRITCTAIGRVGTVLHHSALDGAPRILSICVRSTDELDVKMVEQLLFSNAYLDPLERVEHPEHVEWSSATRTAALRRSTYHHVRETTSTGDALIPFRRYAFHYDGKEGASSRLRPRTCRLDHQRAPRHT